jgi:hypothetical protein
MFSFSAARFLGQAEKLIHSTCAEYTSLRAEMVRLVMGPNKNEGERSPKHIIVTKTQGVEGPKIVLRPRGRKCGC